MSGNSYENLFGMMWVDVYSNEHRVYNTSTDTWSSKNDISPAFVKKTGLPYNDNIYCVGGNTNGLGFDISIKYNISTDSFSELTSSSIGDSKTSADIIEDKIYLLGNNKLQMYDISTDTWSNKQSQSISMSDCALIAVDGKLYSIGGERFGTMFDQIQIYDPLVNIWSTKNI